MAPPPWASSGQNTTKHSHAYLYWRPREELGRAGAFFSSESIIRASPRHLPQSLKKWRLSFPPPAPVGTSPQFMVKLSIHSSCIALCGLILNVLVESPSVRALIATKRCLCKVVMPSKSNWKGACGQKQCSWAAIIITIKSYPLADQETVYHKKWTRPW